MAATSASWQLTSGWCLLYHLEAEPVEVPVVQQMPRLLRRLVAELLDQPVTLRLAHLRLAHHYEGQSHLNVGRVLKLSIDDTFQLFDKCTISTWT